MVISNVFPNVSKTSGGPTYTCFFAMPFREELHFFFLYTQDHLHKKFGLRLERADSDNRSADLLGKIKWQINRADVVIADITGNNPNVFYEIGYIAGLNDAGFHKPLIIITRDDPKETPTDIRGFELIQYKLTDEENFFKNLDRAIFNSYKRWFDDIHEEAFRLLTTFRNESGAACPSVQHVDFQSSLMRERSDIPLTTNRKKRTEFLLRRIIDFGRTNDSTFHSQLQSWIDRIM